MMENNLFEMIHEMIDQTVEQNGTLSLDVYSDDVVITLRPHDGKCLTLSALKIPNRLIDKVVNNVVPQKKK